MRRNSAKLSNRHQFWLYLALIALYGSGLIWAIFHYFIRTPGDFGDVPHPIEPWCMRVHGGAAMLFLILLGTLLPNHVRFAWHARRNRPNGVLLMVILGSLILTGYGLYYLAGETSRAWTHWSHLIVGILLPLILILHIWAGRRSGRIQH
jgi:predicted membrane channel-forming protein YqfA (hemolysin III family)